MNFSNRLGEYLVDKNHTKFNTNKLLKDKSFALLLFSRSTCPPCQKLAPTLKKLYAEYKNDVEIIWVPADDPQEFQLYLAQQPWKSLPLESRYRYALTVQTYTQGIPQLWLFNTKTGEIVSNTIETIITYNSSVSWLDHLHTLTYSWMTNLLGKHVYDSNETALATSDINKKIILLVFLIPQVRSYELLKECLHTIYENHSDKIEIIWVPDNSPETFLQLKKDLPGYHIEFGHKNIQKIVKLTDVMRKGLPLFHPIVHSTGAFKKNAVQSILYAKETLNMPRVLERQLTLFSIKTFV